VVGGAGTVVVVVDGVVDVVDEVVELDVVVEGVVDVVVVVPYELPYELPSWATLPAVRAGAAPLAVAILTPMMAEPLNPRTSDRPNPARRNLEFAADMDFRLRLIDSLPPWSSWPNSLSRGG
jgi:hypothetical protein